MSFLLVRWHFSSIYQREILFFFLFFFPFRIQFNKFSGIVTQNEPNRQTDPNAVHTPSKAVIMKIGYIEREKKRWPKNI